MNRIKVKINEVIDLNTIDLQLEVDSKKEALEKISTSLLRQKRIGEKEVFIADILKREMLESTNMGMGVAIPHGKSSAVIKDTIAIARLTKPLHWGSSGDDTPVQVIFLLAVCDNDNKNAVHIELISQAAALLLNKTFLDTLFTTQSKTELINQIHELIGEK